MGLWLPLQNITVTKAYTSTEAVFWYSNTSCQKQSFVCFFDSINWKTYDQREHLTLASKSVFPVAVLLCEQGSLGNICECQNTNPGPLGTG